jgi:hypothetical protein
MIIGVHRLIHRYRKYLLVDVTFEYDERTRTVLCRLIGDWNWEDFYATFEQHQLSPLNGEARYLIVDVSEIKAINTDAILNLKRAAGWAAEGDMRFYVVITNRYIRTLYFVFLRIYQDIAPRFSLVGTIEEARALIEKNLAD